MRAASAASVPSRAFLLLALLMLCAGSASAAIFSLGEHSIENPRIVITYTKEVSLRSMSIISLDAQQPAEYTLAQSSPAPRQDGAPVFSLNYTLVTRETRNNVTAAQPLPPGTYQLTLEAVDREGVRTLDVVEFEIVGLDIRLVQPRFGVAQSQPFDLYFVTSAGGGPAQARCEYSKVGFDAPRTPISSGFASDHVITGLNYRGSLYLVCEEQTGRMTSRRISLDWDTSAPALNASASPSLVRDPRDKSTIITVRTDDETVCAVDGEPMMGGNAADRSAYAAFHEQRISYESIQDTSEHRLFHEVSCVNLAGRSSNVTLNVTVNFGMFSDIQVLSPGELTNASSFSLVVEPTFAADSCTVGNSTMQRSGSRFSAAFGPLADGRYSLRIACDGARSAQRTYNLTVDTAAPTLTLNASQLICAGAISARWNASDSSGVRAYRYRASDSTGVITEGETIQGSASATLTRQVSGTLRWEVLASDNAGNTARATADIPDLRDGQEEECGLPPFIRLVQPPLGFSLSAPYAVSIATTSNASCRYALQAGVDWSGRAPFSTSDGRNHTRTGMTFQDQVLHVWCQEPSLKNHTKAIRVGVDTSAPIIAITAVPNPVIDPAKKVVVLTATTSDPTYCTYNGARFDGDVADPSTFATEHVATLDFRDVTSTQPMDRPYEVTCMNLAGLSSTRSHIVHINLGAGLVIERVSPPSFTANESITLAVRPNLEASCMWRPAQANATNSTLLPFDSQVNGTHSVSLGRLEEGSHQYRIECLSATEQGTSLVEFVVDRSVPALSALSGPATLCGRGEYTYNITGVDMAPRISYALENATGPVLQGNTTDAIIVLTATSLPPGQYTLRATPISRSNVTGSGQTLPVTFARGNETVCAIAQDHCGNGVRDTGEQGVDCGGTCANACLSCALDTECPLTMSCEAGLCAPLPQIRDAPPNTTDRNNTVDGPPIGSSPDTCTTDFECSLDEECRSGTCVPASPQPTPDPQDPGLLPEEESGLDWIALAFIALGLVIMGGGGIYLHAQSGGPIGGGSVPGQMTREQAWQQTPRTPPSFSQGGQGGPSREAAQVAAQQRAQAQAEDEAKARALEREKAMEQARERASERSERRHDAFRAFGAGGGAAQGASRQQAPQAEAPKGKAAAKDDDAPRPKPKETGKPKGKTTKDADDEGEDDVFDRLEKI